MTGGIDCYYLKRSVVVEISGSGANVAGAVRTDIQCVCQRWRYCELQFGGGVAGAAVFVVKCSLGRENVYEGCFFCGLGAIAVVLGEGIDGDKSHGENASA